MCAAWSLAEAGERREGAAARRPRLCTQAKAEELSGPRHHSPPETERLERVPPGSEPAPCGLCPHGAHLPQGLQPEGGQVSALKSPIKTPPSSSKGSTFLRTAEHVEVLRPQWEQHTMTQPLGLFILDDHRAALLIYVARGFFFYSDPSENQHCPFPLETLLQVPEEPQTLAASPSGSLCWARTGRGPGTGLPQADLAILDRLPGTWKAKGAVGCPLAARSRPQTGAVPTRPLGG